jgi:formate-dependent phosphoribosylglycinamide formyltransferase (GAR transformylase)
MSQIIFYIHNPSVCHLNDSKHPDIWNLQQLRRKRLKASPKIMSLLISARFLGGEGTYGVELEVVFLLVTSPSHLVL